MFETGAFQWTVARPAPAVAVTKRGTPGEPTTIGELCFEAAPPVKMVRAATMNVNFVPFVSPVMVVDVAAELMTRGACARPDATGVTV